jgi:hypothetical protein
MPEKTSPISTAVTTAVILAFLGLLGTGLLNFAHEGGIVNLLGGATHAGSAIPLVEQMTPIEVPQSAGAKFCALTSAAFEGTGNTCEVSFDSDHKRWMMQNRGAPRAARCSVTCLF